MRKVGDLEWRQLSLWDFAPKGSVQIVIESSDGNHIFHYYLEKITEITSGNGWRTTPVMSLEGISDEVLNWCGGTAFRDNGFEGDN